MSTPTSSKRSSEDLHTILDMAHRYANAGYSEVANNLLRAAHTIEPDATVSGDHFISHLGLPLGPNTRIPDGRKRPPPKYFHTPAQTALPPGHAEVYAELTHHNSPSPQNIFVWVNNLGYTCLHAHMAHCTHRCVRPDIYNATIDLLAGLTYADPENPVFSIVKLDQLLAHCGMTYRVLSNARPIVHYLRSQGFVDFNKSTSKTPFIVTSPNIEQMLLPQPFTTQDISTTHTDSPTRAKQTSVHR